ncbi:hypothetical protein J2X31_001139 [Flavobacterium arsenatis]|uniref:DUF6705 domain-containing protein n=1 Tax=Flavobacterium arsenatis TaxID=1484332 RepID=A0ABU1TP05_9FLAO|nr:DUF6705 family protein [Flavobacterium arsenatis]MDR6967132.1 hypothetical protein [Flavobacterium arsenatis]
MKTKVILIFVMLASIYSYAQQPPVVRTLSYLQKRASSYSPESGDYIKDFQNQLSPYIGTWRYEGNGKIFTLKLQRVNKVFWGQSYSDITYFYSDYIILTYKLQDTNGNIIHDNTNLVPTTMFSSEFGYLCIDESDDYIDGSFRDFTTNVLVSHCKITKLVTTAGQPDKIYFELFESHTSLRKTPNQPTNYIPGVTPLYSVPNRIELVRIE